MKIDDWLDTGLHEYLQKDIRLLNIISVDFSESIKMSQALTKHKKFFQYSRNYSLFRSASPSFLTLEAGNER